MVDALCSQAGVKMAYASCDKRGYEYSKRLNTYCKSSTGSLDEGGIFSYLFH